MTPEPTPYDIFAPPDYSPSLEWLALIALLAFVALGVFLLVSRRRPLPVHTSAESIIELLEHICRPDTLSDTSLKQAQDALYELLKHNQRIVHTDITLTLREIERYRYSPNPGTRNEAKVSRLRERLAKLLEVLKIQNNEQQAHEH